MNSKQSEVDTSAKFIALLEAAIAYREAIRTDRNIREATRALDGIIKMIHEESK